MWFGRWFIDKYKNQLQNKPNEKDLENKKASYSKERRHEWIKPNFEDQNEELSAIEKNRMKEIANIQNITKKEKQDILLWEIDLWNSKFNLKDILLRFYNELSKDKSINIDSIISSGSATKEIIWLFSSIAKNNSAEKRMIIQTLAIVVWWWDITFDKGNPINWKKDIWAMVNLAKKLFEENKNSWTIKQKNNIIGEKPIENNVLLSSSQQKEEQVSWEKLKINEDLMDKILHPDSWAHILNIIENIFDNELFIKLIKNIEKSTYNYKPNIQELRDIESDNWYPLFNVKYLKFLIRTAKKYYPDMNPYTAIAICHTESRFKWNAQHSRTKASWLFQFLWSTAKHLSDKIYHWELWNKDEKILENKNIIKAKWKNNLHELWINDEEVTGNSIQYDPIISASSSIFYLYRRWTWRWNKQYNIEDALYWYNPSNTYKNVVMWKLDKIW